MVGWASLAVSLPLIGGGVGLLAIDGHDYRGRCSGGDVNPMTGECRFVYTTTPQGATLVAVGAVLAVVGAVLLARTRDRARAGRPHANVVPFGVVGKF